MTTKARFSYSIPAVIAWALLLTSAGQAQDLSTFAVLAGSTVTNTNPSVITGNIGVSPGGAIVGFPPGIIAGPYTFHNNDAVAAAAQDQLTTAYNVLAGRPFTADLTGQDLGGLTLTPGVYNFDVSAQLTGDLTLDAQGDPNAIFIFNIDTTLTTASSSRVLLINQANGGNVFFRVGSSATLGFGTEFEGKILALASITLVTTTSIDCGAALARTGAVTLDNNVIGICELVPVVIGDNLDDTAGDNESDVADAIDAFGGLLPIGFQILATLTPAELAVALAQLAGEGATGAAPTAGQAMDSFLDLLDGRRPGSNAPGSEDEAPGQGTVSVMGYAPAMLPDEAAPFGAFDAISSAREMSQWQAWGSIYGGQSLTNGDETTGTSDRAGAAAGIAFGLERFATAKNFFGVAASAGSTGYVVDESLGSGQSTMLQVAAYGEIGSDTAYLNGAAAYGIHDTHTDRFVTFAGNDHFAGDFVSHDVAAEVEAGYHLGWLTPYAALRGQIIARPAYSETTVSGSSTYALAYAADLYATARTEIGARAEWTKELETATLSLSASAAWAHNHVWGNSVEASFIALPGSTFEVEGAQPASNALLISLGIDLATDSNYGFGASLDAAYSENVQTISGNAHISHSW